MAGETIPNLGTQVRHDIESSLSSRALAPNTTGRALEDSVKSAGGRLWGTLRRHPYLGVGVLAALGAAIASAVGVGELAFGAAVGYAAYNVLRGGEKPSQAARDVMHELERL